MSATQDILTLIERRLDQARREIDRLEARRAAAVDRAARRAARQSNGDRAAGAAPARTRRTRSASAAADGAAAPVAGNGTASPRRRTSRPAAPAPPAGGRTSTSRRGRDGRSTRAGAARSRRPPALSSEVLESLLARGDLPTTALAEQAGADRAAVLELLRQMEAAGTIRRLGERRATRWHLITDEDRIAARVAELERARRRR